ncbi:hypothetical protein [Mesorhizobium sp. WSM3862]|uniref:hypothetical protein n=1 Tax=Mesorhizobium sp. WSM3862 TaxID=632858 RepID=UPI001140CE22|nr:hypothetical protein [Mesorhizobium sp. WSM3862]
MDQNGGCLPMLFLLGIGAWFLFGDPGKTVANWWWPNDAAPWETVDAFYYPNVGDLSIVQQKHGLKDVQACRDWVSAAAYIARDPMMTHSDYECGLGKPKDYQGMMNVYRATVD